LTTPLAPSGFTATVPVHIIIGLRALLVFAAPAPIRILEAALEILMRLLANLARTVFVLRFNALIVFVRQREIVAIVPFLLRRTLAFEFTTLLVWTFVSVDVLRFHLQSL
jgi:hypothetical protein